MRANFAITDPKSLGTRPPLEQEDQKGGGPRCGLFVVALMAGCGAGVPDNSYQPPPTPEVTVAKPVQHAVTPFIEENGETEVVERAEVRARVRGFLEEIQFEPGDRVSKGDVLYVIQRSEYEAAVNSATASLEAAKASVSVSESQIGVTEVEVTRAQLEFARYESLLEKEAATQAQYDQARAARDAALASREAAKANAEAAKADRDKAAADLERAQLDLDYTLVKAPINGRVTKTEIKRGNLVENGDLMATVVDRDQIYANFNVSDRSILRLQQAARERGEERPDDDKYRSIPAYLRRELDDGYPFTGHLDYIDQEGVDQATGTFSLRAVFDNPEDLILPGLFVRIRVPVGEPQDSLLIPERALSRDQMGTYVLVVGGEDQIERRSVTAGQALAGMVVIEEGIGPDDLVLLDGGQRARPGIEVKPSETSISVPPELAKLNSQAAATETSDADSAAAGDGSDDSPAQP